MVSMVSMVSIELFSVSSLMEALIFRTHAVAIESLELSPESCLSTFFPFFSFLSFKSLSSLSWFFSFSCFKGTFSMAMAGQETSVHAQINAVLEQCDVLCTDSAKLHEPTEDNMRLGSISQTAVKHLRNIDASYPQGEHTRMRHRCDTGFPFHWLLGFINSPRSRTSLVRGQQGQLPSLQCVFREV